MVLKNLFWWSIPAQSHGTHGTHMGFWPELRHLQRPAATASASAADHRSTAGPKGLELIDLGLGEFDEGVFRSPAT